ncbi:DNA binding protein [[Candida] boidinii]|nr:DNA binding protein [[Candida] boidinii]
MSNNKNLFALLGNDVSDDEAEIIAPKEIVKKTTSSKKADVPPPSANKAHAKKNGKPATTGNEAGAKFQNKNRNVEGPKSTKRSSAKNYKNDRHSRTGRTETEKSAKTKLGDEVEAQAEGEADATAELEEGAEEVEEQPAVKSFAEYFEELKLQKESLSSKPVRAANAGNEDKWSNNEVLVKETETLIDATSVKKTKSKAKKEKNILAFEATFADEVPEKRTTTRGPRAARGGNKPRGGRKGGDKSSTKFSYNEENLPPL